MKLFLRSLALLLIAGFSPLAIGQTYWYYVSNGNFNDASNWSSGVPNSSQAGIIYPFLGGTYVISVTTGSSQNILGLGVIGSDLEEVGVPGGTVDLDLTGGSSLNVLGSVPSGQALEGNIFVDEGGTLNYNGGSLQLQQGEATVGDEGGSGTLNFISTTFNYDHQTTANFTSFNVGDGDGAVGTVTESDSTVTTGNELFIGTGGGTGTYILKNGSTLQTGSMITTSGGANQSDYYMVIGSNSEIGDGSSGSLTIEDTSTLSVAGNSVILLGTVNSIIGETLPTGLTGGTGTIDQIGTGSHFNLENGAEFVVGAYTGGRGVYNLSGGTFSVNDGGVFVGETGATGTINQTGGTMVFSNGSGFFVGDGGTGTYNLSGKGVATFDDGFTVGSRDGSIGTVFQYGGTLTSPGAVVIGGVGTGDGTLTVSGGGTTATHGTAAFGSSLTIRVNGTVNINSGGTLQVGEDMMLGSVDGTLNFGGGTLLLAAGATDTFVDRYSTHFASGTSTIDASHAGLTTFTFSSGVSGAGGIFLLGNGSTVFDFASVAGGSADANSYTGVTGIAGGTLNALGADIQTSSGLLIGTAGSSGILNLSTGDLTYRGTVSGTGRLNVNFTGAGETLTLTSGANAAGAVDIALGADTGPNASATPGTLQVYSGSFGTISGAGSNLIVGDNSNSSSGTVTISNGAYTGTTTVNRDFTLDATSLGVGAVTNNGTLNVTGAAGIGGVVTNTGAVNTTKVDGDVINSGTFMASASTATVGGSLTNNGAGLIGSSAALPAAINTPTFRIGGDLTMNGSADTMAIRANGTSADEFLVGGTSSLQGTVKLVVIGGGKIGTTVYTIVQDAGGITIGGDHEVNNAGGLTTSAATALFSSVLEPDPFPGGSPELKLAVTQLPITTYAQTPNQVAVAQAIDGTDSPLFAQFGVVSKAAAKNFFPSALDQLSPESLQYARMIAFENTTFLVQRMNGVCSDLRSGYGGLDTNAISVVTPGFGSNLGRSLGSMLAYDSPAFHQSAPNGVNYYPGGTSSGAAPVATPTPTWDSSTEVISDSTANPYMANQTPSAPEAPRMNEFISGDAVLADLNQNQSAANAPSSKAHYTAGDATAGVSFHMTSHLAAGVLFDYNHTEAKTDSSGSKTDVDSYSPGLFATYFDHGFYANGLLSFGYNNYSNTRNIGFLGENATSSPSGQQYVGNLDFGYDFHPDKNWVVGPTLGGTYTHLDIDSFSESGAQVADLSVHDQSADSLRSRLGAHAVFQTYTGDVLLQPNLTLMWQHEFLDDSSGITSSFNDFASNSFTIQTAEPSRDSALIGVGLTATLSNSMALYLNYLADVGADDYYAQSIVGGFKARF